MQSGVLLSKVQELDTLSVKSIQAMIDLQEKQKDIQSSLEARGAQFACQLESMNRSIEAIKFEIDNQMSKKLWEMQEAVKKLGVRVLQLNSHQRLVDTDTSLPVEPVQSTHERTLAEADTWFWNV